LYEKSFPHKRFGLTLEFLEKHLPKTDRILDLGVENPFSEMMKDAGYQVSNTGGEDLDDDTSSIESFKGKVVTAFEIFEHLVSPYTSLDYVLEKAGWKVVDRIKFTNPVNKFGIRPFLRKFTDRYYMVYCKKVNPS
jgi:hypothetical protein